MFDFIGLAKNIIAKIQDKKSYTIHYYNKANELTKIKYSTKTDFNSIMKSRPADAYRVEIFESGTKKVSEQLIQYTAY